MTEQDLQQVTAKGADDPSSDLGFGRVVSQQRELRLLNRDGSFNVQTRGRGLHAFLAYSNLVSTTWSRFFLFVAVVYIMLNGFFALVMSFAGPALWSIPSIPASYSFPAGLFLQHSHLGHNRLWQYCSRGSESQHPGRVESVVSLLGLAVVTGLVFARFSRPVADILFSRTAVMSWIGNLRSFQFRIINSRNNQIIDLHVRLLVSRFETNASGTSVRRYHPLRTERESVIFFPFLDGRPHN